MSLGVCIKGPEGIVLAADSRVTLEASRKGGAILPVNFDNATKLLTFDKPHNFVGAVTYGAAVIGQRTAHSFIPEFEQRVLAKSDRKEVGTYASELSRFFMERWQEEHMPMPPEYKAPPMTFICGGYDPDTAYGSMFLFDIPYKPKPVEANPGNKQFGMNWGGQLEIASRIVHGFDPATIPIIKEILKLDDKKEEELQKALRQNLQFPIPYRVLPLQDCVDLAIFLVSATISAQRLAIGVRGVGGPIDVATITRIQGLKYVQRKEIHGETSNQ